MRNGALASEGAEGVNMRKMILEGVIVIAGALAVLMASAPSAMAQGPAGSGAAEAAQNESRGAVALNPMKWMKRDSKDAETPEWRSAAEKKLTPTLQSAGLLAADVTATNACEPFVTLEGCLATLHASHSLSVNFYCMRAVTTGVNTTADVSGCKAVDGDKALTLEKTIKVLKPGANAKQAAKDADQQAKDDLGGVSADAH